MLSEGEPGVDDTFSLEEGEPVGTILIRTNLIHFFTQAYYDFNSPKTCTSGPACKGRPSGPEVENTSSRDTVSSLRL